MVCRNQSPHAVVNVSCYHNITNTANEQKEQTKVKIDYICYDNYLVESIEKNNLKFDSKIWHESRNKAWNRTIELLESKESAKGKDKTHEQKRILLIDDNFEYRSMRYKFYQIARQYKIGFLIIYVKCDINQCIQRNTKRKGLSNVSQDIIFNMSNKFEIPNKMKNKWESNTMVIDNNNNSNENETINNGAKIVPLLFDKINKSWDCIPSPIVSENDDRVNKEKQQKINATNLRHCVDERLRKLLNLWMKYCKSYIVTATNKTKKIEENNENDDDDDDESKECSNRTVDRQVPNIGQIGKSLNTMKKELFKTVAKMTVEDKEHLQMLIEQYEQDFDDMVAQYWLLASGQMKSFAVVDAK